MMVVDASVAVKWFLREDGSDAALQLLDANERLFAPGWIQVEVASAISRRFREGTIGEQEARHACDRWDTLLRQEHLELVPYPELYDRALEISFKCRHALVDCFYLALAERGEAELITADRTLHKRAREAKFQVTLLAMAHPV